MLLTSFLTHLHVYTEVMMTTAIPFSCLLTKKLVVILKTKAAYLVTSFNASCTSQHTTTAGN